MCCILCIRIQVCLKSNDSFFFAPLWAASQNLCRVVQHLECSQCRAFLQGAVHWVRGCWILQLLNPIPFSSRKFDSTKRLIFSGTIKIIYLLPFSEILMRKIRRKVRAMCIYSMITQDLSPLLLFFQPIPFPLIVWQLSQIHGAYPTRIRT